MKFFLSSFLMLFFAVIGFSSPGLATMSTYYATLDGPSESPPNASPGTGSAMVVFDDIANTLFVHVSFSGLVAPTTAAHIHAATSSPGTGTAGVATQTPYFTGFPIGVTSGTYDHTFDMTLTSSFNATFVTDNGGYGGRC
jgi:hypothetical protein